MKVRRLQILVAGAVAATVIATAAAATTAVTATAQFNTDMRSMTNHGDAVMDAWSGARDAMLVIPGASDDKDFDAHGNLFPRARSRHCKAFRNAWSSFSKRHIFSTHGVARTPSHALAISLAAESATAGYSQGCINWHQFEHAIDQYRLVAQSDIGNLGLAGSMPIAWAGWQPYTLRMWMTQIYSETLGPRRIKTSLCIADRTHGGLSATEATLRCGAIHD